MTMQAMMNMPMPMSGSMSNMPMQAMMPMMPMMMCTMTMKMSAGKAECEFKPAQGMDKADFESSCEMIEMMMQAGMPLAFQAGNMCMLGVSAASPAGTPMMMPMMMAVMPSMMCNLQFDKKPDMMLCQMTPGQGMNMEAFNGCCKLMDKMMQLGMPMMITCNGSPVMSCTV